jgi:hypothetical protein
MRAAGDMEAPIGRPAMNRILGDLARHPPQSTSDFLAAIA